MGAEMANGMGDEARYAQLSQRVTGLETSIQGLSSQFSTFVAKLDERQRTPWGLIVSIAVALLAYVTTIGGLAYAPVWASLSRLESSVTATNASAVSISAFQDFRSQYENNRVVSRNENIDKFGQANAAIGKINDQLVPRTEMDRAWALYDQRFTDVQRQIDSVSNIVSGQYNQRDLNSNMLDRLDRIERQNRIDAR